MTSPMTARAIVAEAARTPNAREPPWRIRKILIVDDSATERHMLNDC